MKLTSKYNIKNMKKYMIGALICGLAFAGCEKDPVTPEPTPTPTPTPTPAKHNVELVYGNSVANNWQHIELDTIQKYSNDKDVDTIFMIPEMTNQFSTMPTNILQIIVQELRERKNVNPAKVFGKGELQLKSESTINNPEIVRFFADTLGYTVTYYNQVKGR